MKNFFENLDQQAVGIFFASGKIFIVKLSRENDQWKLFDSMQIENLDEIDLRDSSICVCLDPNSIESFRAKIPDMPAEDLRGVIDNEIILRFRFQSRDEFYSTYRKIENGFEIFVIGKAQFDEFAKIGLSRITIFDSETKFPIDRGDSNERAFFGACSIAFPEIPTLNLLPNKFRKVPSRWNFFRLTIALWIFMTILMVGIFYNDRNSLFESRQNLKMLEKRIAELPTQNPIEIEISNRENRANDLLAKNYDEIGWKFLRRISEVKIDSVYVESFERLENRIKLRILGEDIDSIQKFLAELKMLNGIFHEKLELDKGGSWILDLEVETPN